MSELDQYEEQRIMETKTVILIDNGRERLMTALAAKGYGVVHLAAKDANPGMLVCLIGSMSIARRKTALITDVARKEADRIARAIWELFPDTRVVIVEKRAKRVRTGIERRCDLIVPDNLVDILAVLESYATAEMTPQRGAV